jgi:hypothetical protein
MRHSLQGAPYGYGIHDQFFAFDGHSILRPGQKKLSPLKGESSNSGNTDPREIAPEDGLQAYRAVKNHSVLPNGRGCGEFVQI